MRTVVRRWRRRLLGAGLRRRATEAGYAAIFVAIVVPVVGLGSAAVAVDVGTWYVMQERVQKAADAAALAGVPFLPQDMASAKARALEIAAQNGFDDANPNTVITVANGARSSQLKVTIRQTMENTFGVVLGVPQQTITRSGTADYQGPAPMGSPCNTFGNEPDAGTGPGAVQPTGTAQSNPPANCLRTPQLWALIEGPEHPKVDGDRYQTLPCGGATVDGCSGGRNAEYDEFGYVFMVKVQPAAVGTPVKLQLYDPMDTGGFGQRCESMPDAATLGAGVTNLNSQINPYVTYNQALQRYAKDSATRATYCTGDQATSRPMTTSFVLRQQTDTLNPKLAPVQNDTSGRACIKQYGSDNSMALRNLKASDPAYDDDIAASFHSWMDLCTFTPTRAGDYYLQVRSNVALAGTPRPVVTGSSAGRITSGNPAAAALTGNTTSGDGINAFAMRAVTQPGLENRVAVSGFNHMPIFINANTAVATFNLIRVTPGAAGQKVSFSYYDAGDAAGEGTVQVLRPSDATGSIAASQYPSGCSAYGGSSSGTSYSNPEVLTDCTAPFTQYSNGVSKNNGKTETITIPIPADYDCAAAQLSGCWFRVRVGFANGTVNDVTTWDAAVQGDPVRLLQ